MLVLLCAWPRKRRLELGSDSCEIAPVSPVRLRGACVSYQPVAPARSITHSVANLVANRYLTNRFD